MSEELPILWKNEIWEANEKCCKSLGNQSKSYSRGPAKSYLKKESQDNSL